MIEKYIPSEEQAYHLRDKLKGFSEKGFLLAIGHQKTAFLHEKLPLLHIAVSDRKAILKVLLPMIWHGVRLL